MTPATDTYRTILCQINNIRRLLFALGFSDLEAQSVVAMPRSPYLDTTYGNIRSQLQGKIPLAFAKILAHHDLTNARLARIYGTQGGGRLRKKAKALGACSRRHFVLFARNERGPILIPSRCCSRFCASCSRKSSRDYFNRASETIERSLQYGAHGTNPAWLTLTIRNPPFGALDLALKTMLSAWREFRKDDSHRAAGLWQTQVAGYIWALEVTINTAARSWHPHIHVLADMDFMPQARLQGRWQGILEKRGIKGRVMVGRAYTRSPDGSRLTPKPGLWEPAQLLDCLREVTKYTLKPIESDRTGSAQIIELTNVLHNKRLHGSGGTWQIPGLKHDNPAYYQGTGLGKVLEESDLSTARLMDPNDEIGQAFHRASADTIAFYGLLRTYPECAEALRFLRITNQETEASEDQKQDATT